MRASDQALVNDLNEAAASGKGGRDVLLALARRAALGEWNDYFGSHDLPQIALVEELRRAPIPEPVRRLLVRNVTEGKYDGTREESEEWGRGAEAQELFRQLGRVVRPPA